MWVPAITCGYCMQNRDFWTRITSLYGFQPSSVVLCFENRDFSTRISSLCEFQHSPVVFCMQNGVFRTRLTSLYGSHTLFVVLSTHYGMLSTRISSPYGFQPSNVVLCLQNGDFWARITRLCGSQPHMWFCVCKQARLATEWLVSMGPSSHLLFLYAKQRLLDQNNKSLWVPDMTSRFVHAKQRD